MNENELDNQILAMIDMMTKDIIKRCDEKQASYICGWDIGTGKDRTHTYIKTEDGWSRFSEMIDGVEVHPDKNYSEEEVLRMAGLK